MNGCLRLKIYQLGNYNNDNDTTTYNNDNDNNNDSNDNNKNNDDNNDDSFISPGGIETIDNEK